jgi:hypothetical protein
MDTTVMHWSAVVGAVLAMGRLSNEARGAFLEDYEMAPSKQAYAAAEVACTEGVWLLDDALLGTSEDDGRNGAKSVRVRNGSVVMSFDKTNGIGSVSLYHGMYGSDSTNGVFWTLAVSRDGGVFWTDYVSPAQTPSSDWQPLTLSDINVPGAIRIRIDKGGTAGKRVNFDDLAISDYIAPVLMVTPSLLDPLTTRVGAPSAPQELFVSGELLTADVSVVAPLGFELSRQRASAYAAELTLPPTNGVVAATPVYVRLTGAEAGDYAGPVAVTSPGAAPAQAAVSGSVVVNRMPELSGIPTWTNGLVNQALQVEMLATDPDGTVEQLGVSSETLADVQAGLAVVPEGGGLHGTWCWTPRQPGSNVVAFTAMDNEGGICTCPLLLLVEHEWLIAMRPGQTVSETFDTLEGGTTATAKLAPGWKADKQSSPRALGTFEGGVIRTERCGGNNLPSGAANGIYNFGAGEAATATDRAIGFLSSGDATRSGSLMVRVVNRSAAPIPGFQIVYDIEKYRAGTNACGFAIQVFTSSDGVAWHNLGEAHRQPFPPDETTAGYATAPGCVVQATVDLPLLKLPPGESLYLAWNYSVAEGFTTTYAQALAIDNVVIRARAPRQSLLLVR